MRHPAGETITVTRLGEPIPGTDDGQGNLIDGADTTFTISDVAIAPQGSTETVENPGIFVITGFDLYIPFATPALRPTDKFTIRGVAGWQMTGDSAATGWRNPFTGTTPGTVITVKRAS